MNNKSIYLPALTGPYLSKTDILHKNGKSFLFYKDNTLFHYPHFLVSAGSNYKKKTFSQDLNIDLSKGIKLGDSGGYQLATGVIKYTEDIVLQILDWLENNSNYAMNLDFPPFLKAQEKDFTEKLGISVKNYELFAKHKQGKTKLMNVIHGSNGARLGRWYEKVKDFDFEGGWGIGSIKDGNIFYILANFFFLYEKGEINKFDSLDKTGIIHFLGFSRVKDIPLILYIQKKLNELDKNIILTFDSSYPFYTATFGNIFYSTTDKGFKNYKISSDIFKNGNKYNKDVQLPCSCPVCQNTTFGDIIEHLEKDEARTKFYLYLGSHNFYKMLQYIEDVQNLINIDCEEVNKSFFGEDVMEIIKIIDEAFLQSSPSSYIESRKHIFGKFLNESELTKDALF